MTEPRNANPTAENGSTLSDRVRSLRLGDRPQGKKAGSAVIPWAICAILLAMTAAFGYRAYRVQPVVVSDASLPADLSRTSPGGEERSMTSTASTGEVVLQSKGYVVPISLVQVSPKVGGQLVKINPRFEEGEKFKEGEVLAQLEDVDYRAEYEQAKYTCDAAIQRWEELKCYRPEEIEQAKADLEEARRNMQQLQLDLERNKRMTPGLAVAQRDFEVVKYGYEAMENRVIKLKLAYKLMMDGPRKEKLLAAEGDMRQLRAALDKAKWRLDNTRIVAPISGTILTKKAEKGNIVNPSAFSSGISASLCEMADLRRLEIDLSIQERDVANVRKHQRCLVMPEVYQADKTFLSKHPQGYVGYVSRLMPTADRSKGAIPVRVRIPFKAIPEDEAGVYLRPDMGALVSFTRDEMKPDGKEDE